MVQSTTEAFNSHAPSNAASVDGLEVASYLSYGVLQVNLDPGSMVSDLKVAIAKYRDIPDS